MLPLYVAIEPAPVAADVQAALLHACGEAVAPRTCEATDSNNRPTAQVVVKWADGGLASIQVVGASGVLRTIQFAAEDPLIERYRTVGYAVGTLAIAHGAGPEPSSTQDGLDKPETAQKPIDGPAPEGEGTPRDGATQGALPTEPAPPPPLQKREVPLPIEARPARAAPPAPATSTAHWLLLAGAGVGTGARDTPRWGGSGLVGVGQFAGPIWVTLSGGVFEYAEIAFRQGILRSRVIHGSAALGLGGSTNWLTSGLTFGPAVEVLLAGGDRFSDISYVLPTVMAHGFASAKVIGPLQVGVRVDATARFETTQLGDSAAIFTEIAPFSVDGTLNLGLAF
jgi:hypothetical protein